MRPAWVVFKKEVRENLRQRRTVINSLVFGPLLGPLLMILVLGLTFKVQVERAEKPLEIPVVGAERAPNLVRWLEQQGVHIEPPPASETQAILDQDEDVILRIPESYAEDWGAGRPVEIEILNDESRRESGVIVRRVQQLLARYGAEVGSLRLLARGVDPRISRPLQVREVDVGKVDSAVVTLLSFLPYLLIMGAFIGAMYLAIDSTAGERERRSLEPLLANPVPRSQILAGKLLATTAFGMMSLTLALLSFKLASPLMPLREAGIDFELTWATMATILVIVAPIVPLAAAAQTIVASYAKSYREAQSYLQGLLLIPIVPTLALMVMPLKAELWMMSVPFLAQHQLISTLIRGESVLGAGLLLTVASGLAQSLVLWAVATWLYQRESLAISA